MGSGKVRHSRVFDVSDVEDSLVNLAEKTDCGNGDIRERLAEYGRICASRDFLVADAKEFGLSEVEIAKLTGHSRNTIRSILGKKGKGE